MGGFPTSRPRRLRQSPAIRRLVAETRLHPAELVLPVFVREGIEAPVPISAMPGVVQHTLESLVVEARRCVEAGIGGIMVFGVPVAKDARGSGADDPDGILNVALARLVQEVGDDLVVMADLCLDEFTDHGHCGVLAADGSVDNDATLDRYASMALAQAATGAPVLGLSGMMDGQVGYVRAALDAAGYTDTVILAYAAKYTSGLYGPFREAVQSSLVGDRATYQQDPANGTEALRELRARHRGGRRHRHGQAGRAAPRRHRGRGGDVAGSRCGVPDLGGVLADRGRGAAWLDRPRPGDDGEPDRHPPCGRVDHPHLLRPRGRRPPLTPDAVPRSDRPGTEMQRVGRRACGLPRSSPPSAAPSARCVPRAVAAAAIRS